jgi:hypothetical protein
MLSINIIDKNGIEKNHHTKICSVDEIHGKDLKSTAGKEFSELKGPFQPLESFF